MARGKVIAGKLNSLSRQSSVTFCFRNRNNEGQRGAIEFKSNAPNTMAVDSIPSFRVIKSWLMLAITRIIRIHLGCGIEGVGVF